MSASAGAWPGSTLVGRAHRSFRAAALGRGAPRCRRERRSVELIVEGPESSSRSAPPRRIRLIGRALNRLIVRAPWAWPLVRRPMQRFFERSAAGWDDRTGAGSSDHLASLAAALLHVTPAPERALEVGAGTGEGSLLIAREFPQARVRGVDISERMVQAAVAKVGLDPEGRIAFRVADAASLPYDEESFDLVAHLNMPPFVREIARVLRPGGQVIVASSWGEATPFFTPGSVLAWSFAKHGVEPVADGRAGPGTYWVGRKSATLGG
jgi:ubiquinone/menaquinone biosynthesis C-methylase UbiE